MFGTKTTNTRSFSDATNQLIRVHDLTSGEQVVVGRYTKGQNFGGSDVWFRIGKDDTFGFVPRATIDVPGQPVGLRHGLTARASHARPSPRPSSPRPGCTRPARCRRPEARVHDANALVSCLCRCGK